MGSYREQTPIACVACTPYLASLAPITCKFRQRCPLRIARLGARKKLHATLRELAGLARLLQHTRPTQLESSSAGTEPIVARMGSRRAATNTREKSLD